MWEAIYKSKEGVETFRTTFPDAPAPVEALKTVACPLASVHITFTDGSSATYTEIKGPNS